MTLFIGVLYHDDERSFKMGNAMTDKAWVVKAAKQPMVLETIEPGLLGTEDVEVAVEYCGVCHSDLSILNNDWGISQYPAILGHEVVGKSFAFISATFGFSSLGRQGACGGFATTSFGRVVR